MKSNIKNYGNGWQAAYNGDDFIRNEVTYYKDFDCGTKYINCHCRMIYKNRTLSIVLRNQYKVVVTYALPFLIDFSYIEILINELFKTLITYENNIHQTTP